MRDSARLRRAGPITPHRSWLVRCYAVQERYRVYLVGCGFTGVTVRCLGRPTCCWADILYLVPVVPVTTTQFHDLFGDVTTHATIRHAPPHYTAFTCDYNHIHARFTARHGLLAAAMARLPQFTGALPHLTHYIPFTLVGSPHTVCLHLPTFLTFG